MKKTISLFALLGLMSAVNAKPVVDSSHCQQLKGYGSPFLLVLKKGESIFDSILRCANDAKLNNASIHGIGAIQDPTIAYYDLSKQQYVPQAFSGIYELIALNGDVSLFERKRMLHLHTVFGDQQYQARAGHLMSGHIGVTGEIEITPMKGKAIRHFDSETGLNLVDPNA